jgi:serine/threonine protein kinase/Flp pilus assembly protein TadD
LQTSSGTRFGRYELLEQIGAGGMGEVFRARDHDLHRDVAIKFLPEQFASDPDRLARFAQEARTASGLNHPNIITIHEIGSAEGRPYIVMECVDGETLRRTLQRGRLLSVKQTLDIGVQLADGLAKAHAARVVHRDMKPENVMITKDGFAKILDFGLAKLRGDLDDGFVPARPGAAEAMTELSPNTGLGVLLGTAGYMSPEQVRGLPADHRSDQFALGAILYEMATGRKAFHRDSTVQTLSAIIDSQPQPIADLNPAFPVPARWPIERCLAKEPGDRYASTLDLAHELRGLRDRVGDSLSSGSGTGFVSPPLRHSRRLHVLLAIAVVLGALFLLPSVKDAVRNWFAPAPLKGEVRLAVLLDDSTLAADDRARLAGLLDYVVIRLADLNRFHESLSVIPVSEVRESMIRGPGDAKRRLGANLSLRLTVHRAEQTFVVSGTLEDTERLRVLGGDQRTFPIQEFTGEEAVTLVVNILRIQLQEAQRTAWTAAASNVAEARSLFAQGLTQTPYQTGQSALERLDREQSLQTAIDFFNRAIELDPRYADAFAKLGEAYLLLYRLTLRQEHIDLARQNAVKARELDDTRPSTWITLGMIDAQRRAFAEAEADFARAIDRGPRASLAHRELARARQSAGQNDRAEASFRRAIELDPESWANHAALGSFLLAANRYAEAEQAYLTASGKAPDNARIWSNLGGLYYRQGRFDDAERMFERAIGLYEYGAALSNLATIKFRVRKDYTQAARIYERATKAAPRDYRIWQNLASAYYWAPGERERAAAAQKNAIAIIDEARRVEPDNAELITSLADGYAMLGNEREARDLVARAIKLMPGNGEIATRAAAIYEMLGDRTAALRQIEAALKAGIPRFEFDSGPTFGELVKDSRYVKLVNQATSDKRR